MREIKFRAWDEEEKEMVYDIQDACDLTPEMTNDESWFGMFLENKKKYKVMQYTGLKDKEGKEIYEGDILDAEDRIVQVVWHKYCGQWDSKFIKYNKKLKSNGVDNVEWKYRAEVIGNVYEN